jgi:hypothetical protein
MMTFWPGYRAVAVILALVVALTLAAPGRAEADVLTTLAIVSLVVVGVMIVAYLIVANVAGGRAAAGPVLLACVASDVAEPACWPVADHLPSAAAADAADRLQASLLQSQ